MKDGLASTGQLMNGDMHILGLRGEIRWAGFVVSDEALRPDTPLSPSSKSQEFGCARVPRVGTARCDAIDILRMEGVR